VSGGIGGHVFLLGNKVPREYITLGHIEPDMILRPGGTGSTDPGL